MTISLKYDINACTISLISHISICGLTSVMYKKKKQHPVEFRITNFRSVDKLNYQFYLIAKWSNLSWQDIT